MTTTGRAMARRRTTRARAPRLRQRLEAHGGTAIVEAALALPVFLLLVLGMLDFGRAIYLQNALGSAARDAARFASVDPANATCVRAVAAYRDSIADLQAADVTYSPPSPLAVGTPLTVAVRTVYRPITPLVADAIGRESLTLRAQATVRVRNVASTSLPCPPPSATA